MTRYWRDRANAFPFAIPTTDMDPMVVNAWHTVMAQAQAEEERELLAAEIVRQTHDAEVKGRVGRKPTVRDAAAELLGGIYAAGRQGEQAKRRFKEEMLRVDDKLRGEHRKGGDARRAVNDLLNKRFERASKALVDRTTE